MQLSPEQQAAIEQQKEHCPFCQIIAGKIPAQKVYEDDQIIAVLDINPSRKGHLLVMPKEHYPIMPLIPPETFTHLFSRVREISHFLRKVMVNGKSTVFIANGQSAGQQSTHFLVHIIPSDDIPKNFVLQPGSHDPEKIQEAGKMLAHNLPLMLRDRLKMYAMEAQAPPAPAPSEQQAPLSAAPPQPASDLATLIDQNPQLKEAIMHNPDAVIQGIEENPSLKPFFEGVDIHALSQKLNEFAKSEGSPAPAVPDASPQPQEDASDIPAAISLTDEQLVQYIDAKPTLRDYLLSDHETLQDAITIQPRLQKFFAGTTVQDVLRRYKSVTAAPPDENQPTGRRFGGGE